MHHPSQNQPMKASKVQFSALSTKGENKEEETFQVSHQREEEIPAHGPASLPANVLNKDDPRQSVLRVRRPLADTACGYVNTART